MAREGTRSATGNSKPRIFPTVTETAAPTKKRATANTGAKRGPKKATTTKASKPVGVTKKKAPAKKTSVATKAKGVVKKAEGAVTGNPEKKIHELQNLNNHLFCSNMPSLSFSTTAWTLALTFIRLQAAGTKKIKGDATTTKKTAVTKKK
ncbi:hypothetical protein D0Z07_3511 [Hyphodiscus hymeniophilus]|uniref:Uncharacterized protein n=1 Tax=Hyphodiscus hymeniophilus TaxID=353542 RepID=A0A9P6VL76_9HELO|nr:hypothetical protein D0Z07_3511 [Hyphodiscus hymeniophilus]